VANAPRDRQRRDGLRQDDRRIATAAGLTPRYRRHSVRSPPHLVYKWRREIQETVAGARSLACSTARQRGQSCWKLREQVGVPPRAGVFRPRPCAHAHGLSLEAKCSCVGVPVTADVWRAPHCGHVITDLDGEARSSGGSATRTRRKPRRKCRHCASDVVDADPSRRSVGSTTSPTPLLKALKRIPTIGRTSRPQKLMKKFGEYVPGSMLATTLYGVHQPHGRQRRAGVFPTGQPSAWNVRWPSMGASASAKGGYQAFGIRQTLPAARHVRPAHSPTRRTRAYKNAASPRAERWVGAWASRRARRCCLNRAP